MAGRLDTAGEPQTELIRIKNLIATILHTLFEVGDLRIARRAARDCTEDDGAAGDCGARILV
jgi:hypothetical protein